MSQFRVLTVCTGNLCRSPALAVLLRTYGDPLGGSSAVEGQSWLHVSSAGTRAPVGEPMHPLTAAALASLGVPADVDHAARRLTPSLVAEADIVLTATREHRTAAAQAHPVSVGRVFTVLELARLAGAIDGLSGTSPWERARSLVIEARALRGVVRPEDPADDDLPDPIGLPAQAHVAMVARADAAVRAIMSVLVEPPGGVEPPGRS